MTTRPRPPNPSVYALPLRARAVSPLFARGLNSNKLLPKAPTLLTTRRHSLFDLFSSSSCLLMNFISLQRSKGGGGAPPELLVGAVDEHWRAVCARASVRSRRRTQAQLAIVIAAQIPFSRPRSVCKPRLNRFVTQKLPTPWYTQTHTGTHFKTPCSLGQSIAKCWLSLFRRRPWWRRQQETHAAANVVMMAAF